MGTNGKFHALGGLTPIMLSVCVCVCDNNKPECGPVLNVMAALPNIGGALYSMPQSLADAHY